MKEIIKIIPEKMWISIEKYKNSIEEIRIRKNKCISLRINGKMLPIYNYVVDDAEIQTILGKATEFSIHSHMNEIRNGFLTLKNGHRIGICGEAVFENDEILNFKEISSINIRVAKQRTNFDVKLLEKAINGNILIISPPNFGKTTLLREICKYISEKNYNLSIIDERFEISRQTDLGSNVDVILGVQKKHACWLMLKSMSPDYIILDEISGETEVLKEISQAGVKIIATIHANQVSDIKKDVLEYFDTQIEIHLEENKRKYIIKGSGAYD